MTLWRVGPLLYEVPGLHPPADWDRSHDGDTPVQPPIRVEAHAEEPTPAPWAPGPVLISGSDVQLQLRRPGAFVGSVDLAARAAQFRGLLDVPTADDDPPFCPIFETFLRATAAAELSRHAGALLHASSCVVGGRAYVFAGVSGAGKTTLVDGTGDDSYLSDDQSIVTLSGGQATAWGSPFAGLAARRSKVHTAPLAAVVLLNKERGHHTAIERIAPKVAVPQLLRHVCTFEPTAKEAARVLDNALLLCATVPVFIVRRHIDTSLLELTQLLDAATMRRERAA